LTAVGVNDANIGPISKRCLSEGSQIGIHLDGIDMTGSADKLRKNGAVITGAGADMGDAIADSYVQLCQESGMQ
jgi:hypothetical protein